MKYTCIYLCVCAHHMYVCYVERHIYVYKDICMYSYGCGLYTHSLIDIILHLRCSATCPFLAFACSLVSFYADLFRLKSREGTSWQISVLINCHQISPSSCSSSITATCKPSSSSSPSQSSSTTSPTFTATYLCSFFFYTVSSI